MKARIERLNIRNFRGFSTLDIERLGRVNLITGKNNTGKSSLLEALRLLVSGASLTVLLDILEFREEWFEDAASITDVESPFSLSGLFHAFPSFSKTIQPVEIVSEGRLSLRLVLKSAFFTEEIDSEKGTRRFVLTDFEQPDQGVVLPGVVIETASSRRNVLLENLAKRLYSPTYRRMFSSEPFIMPCEHVSSYGGESTAALAALWDGIALSDREKEVVEALRIIDQAISAISMVGGEKTGRKRTAIIRKEGVPYPLPLRSFGDGLNRLFGIALALVNAKDGLLLIDEFENGMHHTVQRDVWRVIFRIAEKLDIQVVATSHSWDTVEAFQEVANEHSENALLIRLSQRNGEIVPTFFEKDELRTATRERVEVR